MIVEITGEAFRKLVTHDTKCYDVIQSEHYQKICYKVFGCTLQKVTNYLAGTVQYYIEDINS